jgi:hypothetical protein
MRFFALTLLFLEAKRKKSATNKKRNSLLFTTPSWCIKKTKGQKRQ